MFEILKPLASGDDDDEVEVWERIGKGLGKDWERIGIEKDKRKDKRKYLHTYLDSVE